MEAAINTANLASLNAEAWMPERADRIRQAAGWEALPPITLGWNKHDGLVLADGNHRLTVARERGWGKIRCRLVGIGPVKAKALGLI